MQVSHPPPRYTVGVLCSHGEFADRDGSVEEELEDEEAPSPRSLLLQALLSSWPDGNVSSIAIG